MSPARLRPQAESDLVEHTRYLRASAGDAVAERFFDGSLDTLALMERMPTAGSPIVGERCGIPGLRSRGVKGFAMRWYYFVGRDSLDVVRLLADSRELSALLSDTGIAGS